MDQPSENEVDDVPSRPPKPKKFRIHFVASFFLFFVLAALGLMVAQVESYFTNDDPILTPFWAMFPLILLTYGVVFSLIFGMLFRLLSSYEVTDLGFAQVGFGGRRSVIPWADFSSVESVGYLRKLRIPVFRIRAESKAKPIYFVNWISGRKRFDALIADYTNDAHPIRALLKSSPMQSSDDSDERVAPSVADP